MNKAAEYRKQLKAWRKRRESIIAQIKAGRKQTDIAAELSVSRARVNQIAKAAGLCK